MTALLPADLAAAALDVDVEAHLEEPPAAVLYRAAVRRALELYPGTVTGEHDGAARLVAGLATCGPPPTAPDVPGSGLALAVRRAAREHFERAYAAVLAYLGAPRGGVVEDVDDAREAIDLAIRLICDPRPFSVLVADAAATLLNESFDRQRRDGKRGDNARRDADRLRGLMARARKMLRVVAPRDEPAPRLPSSEGR